MSLIKPRISFYAEDFGLIKQYLNAEDIVEIFSALQELCIFGETDYTPKNAKQKYCWDKMKKAFDKDLISYQAAVQNGKKGGRKPKHNPEHNPEHNPTAKLNETQKQSSLTLDSCLPDSCLPDSCQDNSADAPAETAEPFVEKQEYAFEGKVIKLKQKHFDEWQRAYPDLNLYAECLMRDDWLKDQPEAERQRWFISTAAYFAKQNERRKVQNNALKMQEEPDLGDYL